MSMLLCVLLNSLAVGQPQSTHWYFGDSAAIEFTDTGVVALTESAMFSREGCATTSDSLGNLLFYTTGFQVWNRDHEIMPNGDSFFIPTGWIEPIQLYYNTAGSSCTQSTMILPKPGSSEDTYIVLTNVFDNSNPRFMSSVVDMTLDGGKGAIVEGQKSVTIDDSISYIEKMSAVRHGNGRDWWIVKPTLYDPPSLGLSLDSSYRFYLLTPEGIEYSHRQSIGDVRLPLQAGETAISLHGDLYGTVTFSSIQVFEFDRCSGTFTNVILRDTFNFPADPSRYYGCEFSPDGSKFYVTSEIDKSVLIQYDLGNINNDGTVPKDTIWGIGTGYGIGQLGLGPDNKIYFTVVEDDIWDNEIVDPFNGSLNVIHNPNEAGLACDVEIGAINLAGKRATLGLPNQPNYSLGAIEGSPCDTISTSVGIQESVLPLIKVYPNPTTGILNIESNNSGAFTLYQLDGRKVFTEDIKVGKNQFELDAFLSGHYLGLLTSNGRVVFSEILIIE